MPDNEHMISIETKLAYQEDTIQALNEVVCQQQKRINHLESTCKMIISRIGNLSEAVSQGTPDDEIPPHY